MIPIMIPTNDPTPTCGSVCTLLPSALFTPILDIEINIENNSKIIVINTL